ncbi:IS66-like element accessory protein TnpA [Roseomonas sp. USHLN139]|uniref:IS66-like element accessory protein TnpA n=1 Tax=Roseomonas sp. USHLN139 TaxID=3081298 RepID=UPI003B02C823
MVEIITGVERRRHWRGEDKLRILAELREPGVTFAEVARRNEVSRGLLWQWRDALRRGALAAEETTFMPLRVVSDLPVATPPAEPTASAIPGSPCACHSDRIEIALSDGTVIHVSEGISATALRRVLLVLRG